LTPLSKEDKILIKSLQECKGYNARQFITEFMNKGWTKNSINRLLVKFRTSRQASGQRHTQCAYWWKRQHSWVAVAESGRHLRAKRNFTWGGRDPSIISFANYSQKNLRLKCCKKRRAQQL